MTQSGFALELARNRDQLGSLAPIIPAQNSSGLSHSYVEHLREFTQTCADAAAALEEVSGETIAAMSASKVLNVSEKTDQVGTDADATGVVKWQTATGVLTTATFALNHSNTTTHVALVAAVSTARYIRSLELDDINCADEVLLSNVGEDEIYGVIKVGFYQLLKSGFMAQPSATARTWIHTLRVSLDITTALTTLVCTFTPVGKSLSTTQTFRTKEAVKEWTIDLEVEPGTAVSWTIEDDNAAHPVATVQLSYIEAL